MTAVFLLAFAAAAQSVVLVAFGVLRDRSNADLTRRIDRLGSRFLSVPQGPSASPDQAIDALRETLEAWEISVVDPQGERRYLAALRSVSLGVVLVADRDGNYTRR